MDRAQPINKQGLTEEQFLAAYNPNNFERPSVTVDMLVFTVAEREQKYDKELLAKELRLLMIKRGDHPGIGQWALPGGFVEINESMDVAARRELYEETNIENLYMEQLYTWGDLGRDPRTRIISTAYMALVDSSSLRVQANDDADDAMWFTVKCNVVQEQKTKTDRGYILHRKFNLNLENYEVALSAVIETTKTVDGKATSLERKLIESNGIAFDHAKIIQFAIEKLRGTTAHTDIVFNLMPEQFTLTELEQVYEAILGTEVDKANFHKVISVMVTETGDISQNAGSMQDRLFSFNPEWDICNIK